MRCDLEICSAPEAPLSTDDCSVAANCTEKSSFDENVDPKKTSGTAKSGSVLLHHWMIQQPV